ncbi:PREDICTED: putative disease resistance RPP13-like protein 1 [Nelumbo nucifera]|uniref:Disease resistance RPP13-like protein 1 n=2 Tax=Nelumbo nucifera TaxID=4432 RepID=A0A1U8QCL8_NELNU|nr:PREDICTED: putative disease resistance RPP13-like protein 1 [Nelumbo nucifera]DAD31884.1 TPA_asm: hypothetical protein HUJ06_010735 [Nelumbo nucifera]
MAIEVIISPLIRAMLDKLDSSAMSDFAYQWSTGKELKDLSETLRLIYRMASSLEDMQGRDPCLPIFLGYLREIVFRATSTLDEFIYEAHRQSLENENKSSWTGGKVRQFIYLSSFGNQILRRHEIPAFITNIKTELVEIKEKTISTYQDLISSDKWRPDEMERRLQTISSLDKRVMSGSMIDDREVFGRREDSINIINMLLSDQYNNKTITVISIVGIGGIGKTTLAQLIYNDQEVVGHFEERAWVCVSVDFDVVRITRAILQSITRKKQDIEQLDPLQRELQDRIRGKRFLLVLDDIWRDDRKSWDALRVPLKVAKEGSRIIVTTRFVRVSSVMGAIETLHLGGLPEESCWELFKLKAFNNENAVVDPILEAIGKKIVEKCKRLPLAINTLGGLLCNELDLNKWESILKSNMWELEGDDTFPALLLSYHHLPAHLKLCFAYCSLFPKGYEFDKETLILLWMAEGFVPSRQIDIMEDLGSKYFDDLLNRSFFQYYGGNKFVMHDLIHDLAEIASKEMYLRVDEGKSNTLSEKSRYISTVSVQMKSVEKEIYKCKELSTLLSLENWALEKDTWHIPPDLFEQFRCLHVLDLSGNRLKSLPDSIGKLKHLRLLNLNRTGIQVLPESLCNLYNLQTLMLRDCNINEFPKSIGSLINLQCIVMGYFMWHKFTERGIGRLCFLKTLPEFQVRRIIGNNNSTIEKIKELCHLQGKVYIKGLENVVDFEESKKANLFNKQRIDHLVLEWNNIDGDNQGNEARIEAVLEGLQPYMGLKGIKIYGYSGLRFPNWMMKDLSCYDMLTVVNLWNCNNCKLLPPFGSLPSLKQLYISDMKGVEYLGKEFYGNNRGYQKLEILWLRNMKRLKEWWGADDCEFPCLRELWIIGCPKLMKLPPLPPTVKSVIIPW